MTREVQGSLFAHSRGHASARAVVGDKMLQALTVLHGVDDLPLESTVEHDAAYWRAEAQKHHVVDEALDNSLTF